MFVRLAFAVATAVEPDILIIDEALSVGDGAFARKSFDRIMAIRDQGASLVFCSHSLFQVEQLCDRAIWIHEGRIKMQGKTDEVLGAYRIFLDTDSESSSKPDPAALSNLEQTTSSGNENLQAEILKVTARKTTGIDYDELPSLQMGIDELLIQVDFMSGTSVPIPQVALMIEAEDGRTVTSMGTWVGDYETLTRDANGFSSVELRVPNLSLLPGRYFINVLLLCERGILFYHALPHCAAFYVTGDTPQLGYVNLPHNWRNRS